MTYTKTWKPFAKEIFRVIKSNNNQQTKIMIMNKQYNIPTLPLPYDLETKDVLKQLTRSHRKLAELKGVALTIPNERILISTLTLQEAKDSSEV